jgi:hypothetical protein
MPLLMMRVLIETVRRFYAIKDGIVIALLTDPLCGLVVVRDDLHPYHG